MKKPNAENYNPDPGYLRQLIGMIADPDLQHGGHQTGIAGPSQQKIAARLGIPARTFRQYLTDQASGKKAPYSVQYCLEVMAGKK